MAENAVDNVVPFRPKTEPQLKNLEPKKTKKGLVPGTEFTSRRGFFQSIEDRQHEETANTRAKLEELANDPRKIVPRTNSETPSSTRTYSEREEADRRRLEEDLHDRNDY